MGAQMKAKRCPTSEGPGTSTQADAELQHIERAIGQLRAMSQKAAGTLNVEYWHERLTAVCTGYVLVPAQRRRIDALRKVLDSLSQPQGDPTSGRKRTTNRLWAKAA
ncbi:hypothetical protein [Caballeronia mineralivorans]|jgi:hypothetical protein|nr:hypothetical protein [Caballeronia mineralivorans]